ncbi:MAG TPA: HIT domain-containing protein [Desulfurivibrionaceae bacterium]|nr:HIT domain-containing protein [Desulfurivibrionaceae bacterium]
MKTLWAPWRMEYIAGTAGRDRGCIFCAAPDQPHAKTHLLLHRDQAATVFMNRFPYANGHLLVAPARHAADLTDLTPEEQAACLRLVTASVTILRRHLNPDGCNIGLNLGPVAGAGIAAHLHWHIVPRWEGDHNFMTVLAEVRTIPEHIDATFDRLLPDFQALCA